MSANHPSLPARNVNETFGLSQETAKWKSVLDCAFLRAGLQEGWTTNGFLLELLREMKIVSQHREQAGWVYNYRRV
jgi:hypothetical protein